MAITVKHIEGALFAGAAFAVGMLAENVWFSTPTTTNNQHCIETLQCEQLGKAMYDAGFVAGEYKCLTDVIEKFGG